MISIISGKQLADSMLLAKETKTEIQLINWLLYLSTFGGKDECIVEIVADVPMDPGSISWYAYRVENGKKTNSPFYNGGLIFHHATNEWSVHS